MNVRTIVTRFLFAVLPPKRAVEKPYVVFVLGMTFCAAERHVSEQCARERMRRVVLEHCNDGWTVVDATPITTRLRKPIPFTDAIDITVGYDHVGVGTVTPMRTVN